MTDLCVARAAEEEEKLLQQELRKAKARMKKHAKLQEWLKKKEERELATAEAEEAEAQAREQEECERRAKFERRAKAQRRKVQEHYAKLAESGGKSEERN